MKTELINNDKSIKTKYSTNIEHWNNDVYSRIFFNSLKVIIPFTLYVNRFLKNKYKYLI